MITTRYVPALIVLFGLALIPTVIHTYGGTPASDGLSTAAVPKVLAGRTTTPTERDPQWGRRRLDTFDWFERRLSGSEDARLFVGRSLDAKRLYHHPELEIAYGQSFSRPTIHHLNGNADLPVHVLRGQDGNAGHLAVYALLSDGSYVGNPFTFQVRNALALLFRPRKPMTLFFVRQQLPAADTPIELSLAAQVLSEAVSAFQAQQPQAAR